MQSARQDWISNLGSLRRRFFGVSLSRRIVIMTAVLVVCLHVSNALLAVHFYDATAAAEQDASAAQATLLAEHASRTIGAVDLSLETIIEKLHGTLDRGNRSIMVQLMLDDHLRRLPQVRAIGIVGGDGTVLYDTRKFPAPPINVENSPSFAEQRKWRGVGLFIDQMRIAKLDNKPFFGISRPILSSNGDFLGVVTALVEPSYFAGFYGSQQFGSDEGVVLARRDGAILASASSLDPPMAPGATVSDFLGRLSHDATLSRPVPSFPLQIVLTSAGPLASFAFRTFLAVDVAAVLVMTLVAVGFMRFLLIAVRARERSQALLEESEQKFRDFAESASDWFWEQDEDLRFIALTEPVRHSGLAASAHIGKTRREVVHHGVTEEQWRLHQQDLDARRPFKDFRIQRISPSGELRHINVSGLPVFDRQGGFRGYRGCAKDITGEVANELDLARRVDERTQQLRAAQEELLRAERLSVLGRLTATVAHELRNPLSSIRNSVFAIKELLAASGQTLERPFGRIERGIARCDRIVSDLLDFARRRELQCATLALDEWLAEVLDEQKMPKDVTLVRALGSDGVRVAFDPDRLQRVVVNLIENAGHALAEPNAEGRPLEIRVSTRILGDRVEIAVTDTGHGIPPDVLPKIFEPLFSTKSFGTGLGLPTVKQIVEQHGGRIVITSKVGIGTTATVSLPLTQTQEIAA